MVVSKNFVDLQNKCLVFQLTIFVKSVCDLVKNYSRIILLELHEKVTKFPRSYIIFVRDAHPPPYILSVGVN